MTMPRSAGVLATGSYLPPARVTNADLEAREFVSSRGAVYRIPPGEIEARTGIRERHASEEPTSALAARAGAACLEEAGLAARDVDLMLLATSTPDHPIPKTAPRVAHLLGAEGAAAWDVGKDCTGFVEALDVACNLVATGSRERVLVIGAERMSAAVDATNKGTAVIFGDGAGAVLVGPVPDGRGWIGSVSGTSGDLVDRLYVPAGGSTDPDGPGRHLAMDGGAVFAFASRIFPVAIRRACARFGVAVDAIDLIVPHQSNRRIIDEALTDLGWPTDSDRVFVHLEEVGNTAAASVPLALDTARRAGRVPEGALLALVAYGAGISWIASLLRA